MIDLKELLVSFDRHLVTCLIANNVQGNDAPHPGTVLSSFLQHLAQLLLHIIAPFGAEDPPPFLHHPEIYTLEFWHAHLNYACARFSTTQSSDKLLGNQLCHWTAGTAETCMKVTHLVVFLPPALGAYVLSQHPNKVSSSTPQAPEESYTLRISQTALLAPPTVINQQAEQIANARRRAAGGALAPYTIPLLADTQTKSSKNRVTWSLKFSLPAPSGTGTTRRFSSVPRGYGPCGSQALEGAVRFAAPFSYQHAATTLLPDSDILALPDHVSQYGPVRAQSLGLQVPDAIQRWLNSGAPRIYDRVELTQPGNRQMDLPSILTRYFCSEITIHQFTTLLYARQAEDEASLDAAATECRNSKRSKRQPIARLAHPGPSGTSTAPLSPAPLGYTPPHTPRAQGTGRSRSPPPTGRPIPIGWNPANPPPEPSPPREVPPANPPVTVFSGSAPAHGAGPTLPDDPMGTGKGAGLTSATDVSSIPPPLTAFSGPDPGPVKGKTLSRCHDGHG